MVSLTARGGGWITSALDSTSKATFGFIGLMALFATNPASAQIHGNGVTTTFTAPFTSTADDTCSGEMVDVTGTQHGVITVFDDPTGGNHANLTEFHR